MHAGAGIVQLASLTIDDQGETPYMEIYNPGCPIPIEASNVHGIFDHHVADKRPALTGIVEWWVGLQAQHSPMATRLGLPLVMVAHNAPFDIRMLSTYVDVSQVVVLDTLYWARKIFTSAPNHKLTTLYGYLGFTKEQKAHDALGDVLMLRDVLMRICQDLGRSVYDLAKLPVEIVWPFGKHKGVAVKDTPKSYLRWCAENMTNLSPELEKEIHKHLN